MEDESEFSELSGEEVDSAELINDDVDSCELSDEELEGLNWQPVDVRQNNAIHADKSINDFFISKTSFTFF